MKVKLGISVILAFLVFLFVTQNTEMVQVDFLSWTLEISLALLVFIMLGFGIIIGWLLNSYLRFTRSRRQEQTAQKDALQAEAEPALDETSEAQEGKEEL
jgi:uncharacterized integral membrane protein